MNACSGLRVLLTTPPKSWYGGHDLASASAEASALRRAGAIIETIELDAWNDDDQRFLVAWKAKNFSPDIVLSLPNAGYALQFLDRREEPDSKNLFTDILSVPCILPWDHLLTQAPVYAFRSRLTASQRYGALTRIRRLLQNPLYRHYVLDSGHAQIYQELGLLESHQVRRYISGAQDHFVEQGEVVRAPRITDRVAFAGNVYAAAHHTSPDAEEDRVANRVVEAKCADWGASSWHLMMRELADLPMHAREKLGLIVDAPPFWHFAHELLSRRLLTAFRMAVLTTIKRPVDFYGNFADPNGIAALEGSRITYKASVPYSTDLPRLYGEYALWVDVTNTPFIHGCGAKVLNCFAAGSFMLMDFKRDLRDAIGDVAESFMFRDANELNAKIERYLNNPVEREEIVRSMQRIIRERLRWSHFFERACAEDR